MQEKSLKLLKSNKGANKLFVGGYGHVENFKSEVIISWPYSVRSCKGKCKTDKEITRVISKSDHSCSSKKADDEFEAECKFKNMVD